MLSMIETCPGECPISLPTYKVYRSRFYILFVFCFLSFNQCLIWSTFSPIYESTESYYSISESTVDLILAWGPICFIPCLPLTYLLLNKRNGLRYCVILLSIISFLSTIIRVIPSIIISSSNPHFSSIALPCLHLGQILNAVCGPLAMAPVSQLSCLWFNTNERTRATTISIMSYNLGSTLSFLLGPGVVYAPKDIPNLLYIHVGLTFLGCILVFIYFPGQPPTPPSPAAELLIKYPVSEESVRSWRSYTKNMRVCFSKRSFVLLVTAGGLIGGTFGVWTSLFDIILAPENYTEKQIGWFGFYCSLAEIIGGLCFAIIADMPRFHHSFQILIIVSFICYFLFILWFNLSIHTIFGGDVILSSNNIKISISVILSGFFQGGASPLVYESLAELMYPLPESLSASILVQFINIISLILFFIAPDRYKILNLIILIIIFLSIILTSLTKFTYKRRDADKKKRDTLVSDDPIDDQTEINTITNLSPTDIEIDTIQMDPIYDTSHTNPISDVSDV